MSHDAQIRNSAWQSVTFDIGENEKRANLQDEIVWFFLEWLSV